MRNRSTMGERLRRAGFDLSRFDRSTGHWRVRCSQCEALVINGVACHETGCLNNVKKYGLTQEEADDRT